MTTKDNGNEAVNENGKHGKDILRMLVDLRDRNFQKSRVALNNQIKAIESGRDTCDPMSLDILTRLYADVSRLEEDVTADIITIAEDYPIVSMMAEVKGVGFLMAAKTASMIDITLAPHVSSLWRYAGYGVRDDGTCDRLVKGEKSVMNRRLKATCYNIGVSLIRKGEDYPYRDVYDKAREYYTENRDWTEAHCHFASLRKVIKMWLQHLWITWRKLEGLPVSLPWQFEHMSIHTHYLPPEDFGWQTVADSVESGVAGD